MLRTYPRFNELPICSLCPVSMAKSTPLNFPGDLWCLREKTVPRLGGKQAVCQMENRAGKACDTVARVKTADRIQVRGRWVFIKNSLSFAVY